MVRIDLNGLYGTREAADDLLARSRVPDSLRGQCVAIYCRDLLTGSTSFADELVRELLLARQADRVVLIGATGRFAEYVQASARRRDVADRVTLESAAVIAA